MQLKTIKIGQWSKKQKKNTILLGTQTLLRRNLNNFPFRSKITDIQEKKILTDFQSFYSSHPTLKKGIFTLISDLSKEEQTFLTEEKYLTPKIEHFPNAAVLILPNFCSSILINTEEHFIISANDSKVERAYTMAENLDNILIEHFDIAYSPKLGFLTSKANFLSNGMEIISTLHLPAIHRADQIQKLRKDLKNSLYNFKDYYSILGTDYYNLSNMGKKFFLNPELEVINLYDMDLKKIMKQELVAKKKLKEKLFNLVEDEIFRIYGILKYAKFLEFNETLHHIGSLLFGIELEIIKIDEKKLKSLFMLIHPGHIRILDESIKTQTDEDVFRAYLVQKELF